MQVDYLPVSAIITTFRKQNVKRPLEGFGVLVPSKERKNGFETLGDACFLLTVIKTDPYYFPFYDWSSPFSGNRYTFFLHDVS